MAGVGVLQRSTTAGVVVVVVADTPVSPTKTTQHHLLARVAMAPVTFQSDVGVLEADRSMTHGTVVRDIWLDARFENGRSHRKGGGNETMFKALGKDDDAATTSGNHAPKTIYLIRHAQSEENVQIRTIQQEGLQRARQFQLPTKNSIKASWNLLTKLEDDAPLSDYGRRQVEYMAALLQQENFVQLRQIQLIVHSPLSRARETCQGLFGRQCEAMVDLGNKDTRQPQEEPMVLCLDCLRERTPREQVALVHRPKSYQERLQRLEEWLSQRGETVVVLVGHSQFFKTLLGHSHLFGNCDVWQVQFQPHETAKWHQLQPLYACPDLPSP